MLFSPLRIRSATLPNRLVLPAMVTRLSGEDGHVNDDVRARYVGFSRGGVGLVVLEAMAVSDSKSGPLLRISNDSFVPGLSDLAKRCHDAGPGLVFPQIIHFLKIARSGWRQTVDLLSKGDIDQIVELYRTAAIRSRACGFDGVELHMAHAYTLSSFLSRLNARRDEYGGTLENRLRLPTRVLRAVRAAVGDDFPIGVRFVGDECIRNGYTPLDAGPIACELARAGADYVSLSAGGKFEDARHILGEPLYPYTGYSGDRCMPGANYPDGANLYIPRIVRDYVRRAGLETPIIAAGKIGTRALAEKILNEGDGDLIGIARGLLADPDLPNKWKNGEETRVVRCVYGNVCKALDENFKRVDCTLWPKKKGQAPHSDDRTPPTWPSAQHGGPNLRAEFEGGRVLLRWTAATDNEEMYGYEVFRAESWNENADAGAQDVNAQNAVEKKCVHYTSVRGKSLRFEDARVVSGASYAYAVRPYDLAGNRGPRTDFVHVRVPEGVFIAEAASKNAPQDTDACIGKQN